MRRLVYTLSLDHSGSTLLDFLLSGNQRICGLGEACRLIDPARRPRMAKRIATQNCTCGAAITACPLWSDFLQRYDRDQPQDMITSYGLFMESFAGAVGSDVWMCDSSKEIRVLQQLAAAIREGRLPDTELRVIHLVKDVRAWAVSVMSRDRKRGLLNAIRTCRTWKKRVVECCQVLGEAQVPFVQIGYEELCLFPEFTLKAVCKFLNVEFDSAMLSPANASAHIGAGNPMRRDKVRTQNLFYDHRWFVDPAVNLAFSLVPGIRALNQELVYGMTRPDPQQSFKPPQSDETDAVQ